MPWVEILPPFTSLFRERRWESAASFLAWTGILVNKHRKRQVEWVVEPEAQARVGVAIACASGSDASFYLKKEFAVSWRDRLRNAWHGFGWCASAVREAATLQALRAAGIGCPEVVALGEDGRRAFMLTRDESAMTELRAFLPTLADVERHRLADALGSELAKMHDAGFDHPDLFAKHILAARDGATIRFCILDWQRSRRRKSVPWRLRCRDLAVLDATLHEALASDRLRLRCLRGYSRYTREGYPPLRRLARQIRLAGQRLRDQLNIREIGQVPAPAKDHQFVPCCAGQLQVVRSYYEGLGGKLPAWLAGLCESDAATAASLARASSSERLSLHTWPRSGASWDMPPLAHTLFRLQRFGVRTARLLAVGCSPSRAFLLAETPASVPLAEAFAKASAVARARMLREAGAIVRQLHEAGYCLPPGESWEPRLGVTATSEIVLARVETLLRGETRWQELAPREFNRRKIRLSRTEQLRFLQGYLQRKSGQVRQSLSLSDTQARERQVIS